MTSESKTWDSLKTEYLHQVEKALSSVKHPRSKEVLEDVRSHLDRRFAELGPDEQTWENFQAIITEMGPASDYAELLESAAAPRCNVRRKYLLWLSLAAVVIIVAVLLLMAIPGKKVGYIVTFEPVKPFAPQTARGLLDAFNENHPRDIRTHHFRTGVHGDRLQGHICVDTTVAKQAVVTMIDKSDKLILVSARHVTQKELERHYALGQPSLGREVASKVSASFHEGWRCIELLDTETRTALVAFEEYYFQQYHVETGCESASEEDKAAMIEQWVQQVQSANYDEAVRAAAALNYVKAPEVTAVMAKVATSEQGSNRVKWVAVRGLAKMAQQETVPALITLIDHHNKNVRTYAKVALAEISGQFFGDSKEDWCNWARKQGIDVSQVDMSKTSSTAVQRRTYQRRAPRARYPTVSRTGNWPGGNCAIGGQVFREAACYRSVEHARVCLASEEFGSWLVGADYGSFEFQDIPASLYTLRTTDTFGYQDTYYNPENDASEQPTFRLKDGEKRWQIRLKVQPIRPYLHIAGRVLGEDGKPIANNRDLRVEAWLQLPQGHLKGLYRSVASSGVDEQDGSYLLRELDGRPVYVMVGDFNAYKKDDPYPPRFYPGTFSRSDAKMITFDNHESIENADIQLARKSGLVLKGVVTDESTGQPVSDAMVVIRHADMLYDLFPVYADESGRYRIDTLGEGEFLAYVDVMHKGFVKTRKFFTIKLGAKETQLDVTLRRGVRISGKFVDEDGKPWQVKEAHGSASVPGFPYVGNASNFPYYNKYAPLAAWGTTVFYNVGEGDQPSSMMVYPTRDTFVIQAMMPGKTRIQFGPRKPRGRVLKVLYNGKDIRRDPVISTQAGQEIKDVTFVIGAP